MEIRKPIFTSTGSINCELNHEQYGWIPFTASENDVEQHGREIFAAALAMGPSAYVPPPPEELLQAERETMRLSFAQLLIGLVDRQWISEADGISWLSGTLPPSVVSTINLLPAEERFAATAKCLRPSYVYRLDQIVLLMAKVRGISDVDVDTLFRDYASR